MKEKTKKGKEVNNQTNVQFTTLQRKMEWGIKKETDEARGESAWTVVDIRCL